MHMNLDPFLVDKIVGEVKSQGVFDQFRRDSMADVDTKPAYQNLRQRVEMSVSKFLSEQLWTSDSNKNQLREKLRKHITEAGFLDTGVERIVDQVVNPKISTVFQPKIEDIAYKYLGYEKPQPKLIEKLFVSTNGNLTIETDLLPTDLEAVSPDSDKISKKSESKEDLLNDSEEKNEEFESPPFEPIEGRPPSPDKKDDSNHSQLSGISGLTSQDSISNEQDLNNDIKPAEDGSQESELSQVSSNSRLSIVTNDGEDIKEEIKDDAGVDISENAQMPKFSENSNSNVETNEPLHFDIKKEDIKFEGTDRSEKNDYQSSPAKEFEKETDFIKMEVDEIEIKSEQQSESKFDEVSMESIGHDMVINSDTQISACSKNNDFEKDKDLKMEISDISRTSASMELKVTKEEISCSSKDDSIESNEHSKSSTKSNDKESSRHSHSSSSYKHKKHYKSKRSDKDKEKIDIIDKKHSSSDNNNRHSTSRPHSSASSKDSKSSSDSKSKIDLKKTDSLDSRDGKSSDQKSKYDKEKTNGKKINDDHSSARHKIQRRKSTDSNDGDSNKEGRKNNTNSEISINSNIVENFSNTNGNGTSSNEKTPIDTNNTTKQQKYHNNLKPVILDELLTKQNTNNIELVIGNNLTSIVSQSTSSSRSSSSSINSNNSSSSRSSGIASNGDLKYFKIDDQEEKNVKYLIEKLSDIIENELTSQKKIYLLNCEHEFEQEFNKISSNIINFRNHENNFNNKLENNSSNQKIIENHKTSSTNINNLLNENEIIQNILEIPTNLNGKRKRKSDDLYSVAYRNFADDETPLIIDCTDYNQTNTNNKIFKSSDTNIDDCTKISPTFSELSSKENEFIGKSKKIIQNQNSTSNPDQINNKSEKNVQEKRASATIKASQRYSSDDLYKPRPVLSQRSRRRVIDTEII